jgi:hydroxylamine dehydrogenase
MNWRICVRALVVIVGVLAVTGLCAGQDMPVSEATQDCIGCHSTVTPGIVGDWKRSRHARTTPADALKKPELERRVSVAEVPTKLAATVVGCAECHTLNTDAHKDTFNHNDVKVHLTVTPKDCAVCHPVEVSQFDKNLMAHARGNLANNALYGTLEKAINGVQSFHHMKLSTANPDAKTGAESCYHCHGTALEVTGTEKRDSDFGEMEFPKISGWPNQGVGRYNPDGSKGLCVPCHSRHQFSIETARKPYTCSQCHKGPDVPAFQTYSVSKHGNLFSSLYHEWNFTSVPWTVGKDIIAPTCAVCHASLLVDQDGDVLAKRTHQMNDRLPWRIFGLIYAHAHPISPDTSLIRNKDGLPLPTALTGEPATKFLISAEEQKTRQHTLQKVCQACHTRDWIKGHWDRFENTITTSNEMTHTATDMIMNAWQEKLADNHTSLFDEAIEKQWVEQWLFYGNSTRFASAMMGADYGVFAHGRWNLSANIRDMLDRLKFLRGTKGQAR